MQPNECMKFLQWGLGLCFVGFTFLLGYIIKLHVDINHRPTFKWIEDKFAKDVREEMDNMRLILQEIRDALLGDFKTKGAITVLQENKRDIEDIKAKCEIHKKNKE